MYLVSSCRRAFGNGIYINVIYQCALNTKEWNKCTEQPEARMRLPREPKSPCDSMKSLTNHVIVLLTANYHSDSRPNWIMKWLMHYVTAHWWRSIADRVQPLKVRERHGLIHAIKTRTLGIWGYINTMPFKTAIDIKLDWDIDRKQRNFLVKIKLYYCHTQWKIQYMDPYRMHNSIVYGFLMYRLKMARLHESKHVATLYDQ
jgi:hypothetical protein